MFVYVKMIFILPKRKSRGSKRHAMSIFSRKKKRKSVKKKPVGRKRKSKSVGRKSKSVGRKSKSVRRKRKSVKRKSVGHKSKPSKRRRRRRVHQQPRMMGFGSQGPGFEGPTSFKNGYVNYFGAPEPFINATEAWYPNPGSTGQLVGTVPTNYQSPDMIHMY